MTDAIVPLDAPGLVADPALAEALLALNRAHEVELSPLTAIRLARLVKTAFAAWRIGEADALLIAFDQAADYDSPNFLWFRDHYQTFVYVDRVVVATSARGHGHARRLYEGLFAAAEQAGHSRIVCEVNSDPPNPQSDAFHAKLGFAEVGAAHLPDRGKQVRYLVRQLARPSE